MALDLRKAVATVFRLVGWLRAYRSLWWWHRGLQAVAATPPRLAPQWRCLPQQQGGVVTLSFLPARRLAAQEERRGRPGVRQSRVHALRHMQRLWALSLWWWHRRLQVVAGVLPRLPFQWRFRPQPQGVVVTVL